MTPAGFEPPIPAIDWPQIQALDRAVTGSGIGLVQGGPKLGIQYTIYHILYIYFWLTFYIKE